MNEPNGIFTGQTTSVAHDNTRPVWMRMALSYALAIVCLVWVFHDYDLRDFLRRTAAMNLFLVAIAIVIDVLSFVCQGLRWKLLLRPFGAVSVLETTQAIYTGLFINQVLPMKLGELLRAYLISRWTSVKLGAVATSVVIERLFDGFWVVAAFVVTMILVPLPRRLIEAGDTLSAVVLILGGLLIALSLRRASLQRLVESPHEDNGRRGPKGSLEGRKGKGNSVVRRLTRSFKALIDRTAIDSRAILYSPSSLFAFALSLLFVSLQWLAFWLVMLAYGLRISLLAGAAVFVIVHVGSALPSAPASIGTYQFFTVLGLVLFGVDKTAATGFSVVVFILLSVPIWILGFWALRRSGLTILGLRTELNKPFAQRDYECLKDGQ